MREFRVSREIDRDKYNSLVTRYESFVEPSTWTQLTELMELRIANFTTSPSWQLPTRISFRSNRRGWNRASPAMRMRDG